MRVDPLPWIVGTIIIGATVGVGIGVFHLEKWSTEKMTRECHHRWEGRSVRYDRQIGCQVRDSAGWVPEANVRVSIP